MEKPFNRYTGDELLNLLCSNDILALAQMADIARQAFHPDDSPVTFVIDRNINYTNICSCKCKFCAFYRKESDSDSYVLDYSTIKQKVLELTNIGGTQLLLQGGLNNSLDFDYYLNILSSLRKDFPALDIHSFSPPEIDFISNKFKIPVPQLINELVSAGLSSIPGGGAELLSENIRNKISPSKVSSERWLEIMGIAHSLGLKTTATMVFGFGESLETIVAHFLKIRELQDRTGGFTAFIPWTFQPTNTQIDVVPATSWDYLKVLAVSRIALDNISNIQTSWVTQGSKIAQLSLRFGANDFGGTMMEENVVRAAGVANRTTVDEIIGLVHDAGFSAAQRDTQYNILKIFHKENKYDKNC